MTAAVAVAEGISEDRSRAIQHAAVDLAAGLDALVAVGGWTDGDTVPAVTVRCFVDKMRGRASLLAGLRPMRA